MIDDEIQERQAAIKNLYHSFDRILKEDTLAFIIGKTQGVALVNLVDVCRKLQFAEELPKNVSREIILLAGEKSVKMVACPDCCYYLDDKIELPSWGERIPYAPGLRHYRYTYGEMKWLVGHAVPCQCEAGRKILAYLHATANQYRQAVEPERVGA